MSEARTGAEAVLLGLKAAGGADAERVPRDAQHRWDQTLRPHGIHARLPNGQGVAAEVVVFSALHLTSVGYAQHTKE
jgi:hypothetical protein